jgi:hypothetical protein
MKIKVSYREYILPGGFTGHRYGVDDDGCMTLFKRPRIRRGVPALLLIAEVIQ